MEKGNYFELNQQFIVVREYEKDNKKLVIENVDTKEQLLMSKDIAVSVIGEYKDEIEFKNRTELIRKFEEILPFTANRLLQVEYYKNPDWKELYKSSSTKTYKSQKEYEKAHKYGEHRVMKGSFVLDGFKFKEKHSYLVMADIEENGIEKMIIIKNLTAFVFDNKRYYINE